MNIVRSLPWKSKLFLVGLAVRVAMLPFFGYEQMRHLFIPFLDFATQGAGSNPWAHFSGEYFPYGSFLFLLLFIPRKIAWLIAGNAVLGTGPVGILLLKLPLLFLDLLLFKLLFDMAEHGSAKVLKYYWLNPIAIFVTYYLGQLDLASMAFTVLSLVLFMRARWIASSLAFAAATLCKFHVVLLVPFLAAAIWNRHFRARAVRTALLWLALWGAVSAIGFLPHLAAGKLFYSSTSSPEAFRMFALSADLGDGQKIFFGVLAVVLILGRLCISTRINDAALFFGSATLLGSLLLVTRAAPGWYFWIVPFLSIFFAMYSNAPVFLHWLFVFFYLVHFYLVASVDSEFIQGFSFTLLQTTLFGVMVTMWVLAVRRQARLQGRARPRFIGIAGDSGAGKNHLSRLLVSVFGSAETMVIEGDDYHKWERQDEKWRDFTHLNPRANRLETLSRHASKLEQGVSYLHASYDHRIGEFTDLREVKPLRTVILQGLHALYQRNLRNKFGLSIFVDPDHTVRAHWKVRRDAAERGHTAAQTLESLRRREDDSKGHIQPQKEFADWILRYVPERPVSDENLVTISELPLHVNHVFWNDAPITRLVDELSRIDGLRIKVEAVPADINRVHVEIEGAISREQIGSVAQTVFPNLRHLTRGQIAPDWSANYDGITQLFALALLSVDEESEEKW